VCGEESRKQSVARTDGGDGLDAGRLESVSTRGPLLTKQREAARLLGDQHGARAMFGDRVEPENEVLVFVELLADEPLRLVLIRRDEKRLRLDAKAQRLPLGVEHCEDPPTVDLADRLGVEGV